MRERESVLLNENLDKGTEKRKEDCDSERKRERKCVTTLIYLSHISVVQRKKTNSECLFKKNPVRYI